MRVLHVGKYFPPHAGGMETFLGDLLPALNRRGCSAAAIVHAENATGRWPEATDPLRIYRVPSHGSLLYAPLSPTFPFWLHRAIADFHPDLLHLHLPNTSAFWCLPLLGCRKLPWVVHWHADVVPSRIDRRLALAYELYRPAEQALLRRAAAIIATSPPYLEASTALAPHRPKARVVPLGIDRNRLLQPEGEELALWPGEGLRVLTVGRLTYYKGHNILLQALATCPEIQCVVVGNGELAESIQRQIASLNLQGRVRLAGQVNDQELATLYRSCDLFCLPSLERTEAFGVVLMEAMHFGKAIVASDIPGSGVGWVVDQSSAGLLAPVGDPATLAATLRRLAADPSLRRQLGNNGRQRLAERFEIGEVADAIIDRYRSLLDPSCTSL